MSERAPTPLSVPRDPSPEEAKFCREQARMFHAVGPDPLITIVLIPACMHCGSGELHDNRMTMSARCADCGRENATDVLHAGRLAFR